MPLSVSVVIPAYNCQQYIAESVESAIAQSSREVIVIDDGSTDHTAEVIKGINHSKLNYVHQDNRGVGAARNEGIRRATGDLIAFLDADDVFLPEKLAQQIAIFETAPELGLVQSGWQLIDETGQKFEEVTPWGTTPELTLENWLKFKPVLPSALMVRRDLLLAIEGFDPQLRAAEDVDLVCRLALNGCQSAWLKSVGVSYRQRANSAMGNGLVQAQDLNTFLNKFFQQPDLPECVQLMEASVRYHTMVWAAWYLHHTGYTKEMSQYLNIAWEHSPYLPIEALIHWVESFEGFSRSSGKPLDMAGLTESDEWKNVVKQLLSKQISKQHSVHH